MQNKKEVYAKKKFGQNFLKDQNILRKIINVFDVKEQKVLEIGPGRGALTNYLLNAGAYVTAFEIDTDMVDVLNKEINNPNFKLIHQDFLEADITNFKDTYIIANIPYYITTDILFKIFENKDNFEGVLVMVQKEVAQRVCAKPNTKDYSKLSVSSQFLADCKLEFIVPANAFSPAPKVESAILSLRFKNNVSLNEWNSIKDFFKLCFENRRKKLSYSLQNKYSKDHILNIFEQLGYDDNLRIQQLSVEKIVELFNMLEK
ncbi:16S rRNA (adenine(1518)-N(6)/adenine(1519)-N(6))-dimethyltransferase RsmA [Mycoplasma sp. 4463]|uniref:16S rRNA (adenine(1518)-N(6)/adenine(1519)-N(6))- dimethyltransferase RsmA n=1 Tax=Mycoplasma sp. 4463 TaxID=3400998 RepID=UPI003AAAC324